MTTTPRMHPLLDELPHWMDRARCAEHDPELFHPAKGESPRDAKLVCKDCEVLLQCGRYALADPSLDGIWGGLSMIERRHLRRNGGSPYPCRHDGCGTTWTTPTARAAHERACERREEAS